MVQIEWRYSRETEAVRIIHVARGIRKRFYQKKGFLVLPYLLEGSAKSVYFPTYEYFSVPHFWDRVLKQPEYMRDKSDREFVQQVVDIIDYEDLNFSQLKTEWGQVHDAFFKELDDIIPDFKGTVDTLEVRPTLYGTMSTAHSAFMPDKRKVIVYVRQDMDCSHIAEAILIDRLDKYRMAPQATWEELEEIMDFILHKTKLNKLFPRYKTTMKELSKEQLGEQALEAQTYVAELGFPSGSIFDLNGEEIFLYRKKLVIPEEDSRVLSLLIQKKNSIVTMDEVAEARWGEEADDKYSLYAISKAMHRIRLILQEHGIRHEVIHTFRNRGYCLLD